MADAETTETTQTESADTRDTPEYWQAEAKKLIKQRDDLKKKIREYQSDDFTPEQREEYKTLKEREAQAEEERKRKAGEFDALRRQQQEKHEKELAAVTTNFSKLHDKFKHTVISAEFGKATDYFSGAETAKTILDVDLAIAALGKYVAVEDADEDPLGYRVVVKNPRGEVIAGKDGNPAPFADAIGELIGSLPNKDRILRGSGKTGSGSSGGSTVRNEPDDVQSLTARARAGDKQALEALQRRAKQKGSMVVGPAFQ